jgi:hypothetical protein
MSEASIADILADAENPAYVRVTTARLLLRHDLVVRHEELEAELNAAILDDSAMNRLPEAPRIVADIEALETEIEASKVSFKFRAIGKRAWADLIAKHPPTKDQRVAHPGVDHNPETFPITAIAASCIEPVLTVDDVGRLERALASTQFDLLWAKCVEANVGMSDPKSSAAGLIRRARLLSANSVTAAAEPSLAASFSDE